MMDHECIALQDLDLVLHAGEDDQRRDHLLECPRCRASLAMYQSFLEGNPDLADKEMEARVAAGMHQYILENGTVARNADDVSDRSPVGENRFLNRTGFRSLMGLAAVLVVIVAIDRFVPGHESHDLILRSSDISEADQLELSVAILTATGDIRLSWTSVPRADSYNVEILGSDLSVLQTESVSAAPTLDLPAGDIATWQSESASLLWRVTALAKGHVLARSAPRKLVYSPEKQ